MAGAARPGGRRGRNPPPPRHRAAHRQAMALSLGIAKPQAQAGCPQARKPAGPSKRRKFRHDFDGSLTAHVAGRGGAGERGERRGSESEETTLGKLGPGRAAGLHGQAPGGPEPPLFGVDTATRPTGRNPHSALPVQVWAARPRGRDLAWSPGTIGAGLARHRGDPRPLQARRARPARRRAARSETKIVLARREKGKEEIRGSY